MTAAPAGSHGPLLVDLRGRVGGFRVDAVFRAPAGETTAIFGPSGSGKTTVLRAVAGLARLAGDLKAGSQVWQEDKRGLFVPPHRRRIGFAFQEPVLFGHLSVEGNLRYAERRAGPVRRTPSFSEVVEHLGIRPHLARSPGGLSGGERQRVSLGRALLTDPAVLLLDEPLSALDRRVRRAVLPWLRRVAAASSMVVLYVSHDLGEVVQVAHRIALMEKGRITSAGPVAESLERLEAEDARSRFETSSLLIARVRTRLPELGLSELDLDGQALRVPGHRFPVGTAVRLRVRARDVAIALVPPDATSIRNILPGTVRTVARTSASPFAEVRLRLATGARLRARITREAADALHLGPGLRVFALLKSVALDEP